LAPSLRAAQWLRRRCLPPLRVPRRQRSRARKLAREAAGAPEPAPEALAAELAKLKGQLARVRLSLGDVKAARREAEDAHLTASASVAKLRANAEKLRDDLGAAYASARDATSRARWARTGVRKAFDDEADAALRDRAKDLVAESCEYALAAEVRVEAAYRCAVEALEESGDGMDVDN
jgi:predicted  nucleic acid-binding Zn-ribbon protein